MNQSSVLKCGNCWHVITLQWEYLQHIKKIGEPSYHPCVKCGSYDWFVIRKVDKVLYRDEKSEVEE